MKGDKAMYAIRDVMSTDLVTVTKETSIFDAIELLKDHNITGMPVVDEEMRLVGMVSERDMLMAIQSNAAMAYVSSDIVCDVQSAMTTDVMAFDVDDPLSAVWKSLKERDFRSVPILSDGTLVGIISLKELILPIAMNEFSWKE